ncbi:endonuclease III [Candidatus Syntrophocurvum alkaliphilum]|nr:endonuclease III [Candidatus Syntrophocurvum alkaliphilum]
MNTLENEYPLAGTELEYSNLFELLISIVLSAQSTDFQVNRVTKRLFKRFKGVDDFANANINELENLIKGVGIYKNKAKNIKHLAIILRDKYNGNIPNDFNELIKLPGVGRKTANVLLSVGFNYPALGVDTHVQRVSNRLGLVKEKNPEKTELMLKHIFPRENWTKIHHLLIHHGRKVCKAKNPDCLNCVLNNLCSKII